MRNWIAAVLAARRLAARSEGQDLVEYALLASLIAMFVIGAVSLVGQQINGVLWEMIAAADFLSG